MTDHQPFVGSRSTRSWLNIAGASMFAAVLLLLVVVTLDLGLLTGAAAGLAVVGFGVAAVELVALVLGYLSLNRDELEKARRQFSRALALGLVALVMFAVAAGVGMVSGDRGAMLLLSATLLAALMLFGSVNGKAELTRGTRR